MMLPAVVFVLAVASECLAAQSDRSRHDSRRSGPIRSVPVAADIKRDADFDCPEEFGYYPHPNDCTLYYVCVFGGALLESCTGGLMYSHELQTCDWPRNVGCDATGTGAAVVSEDLERISERERNPPPPPPPRRNPPPPPRAQPNPVVTSRGQPKFNRDEYEKQQLYADVEDDLPPVEEIESDRQQRVYRGQPSTIGQVQKDRDGYVSQVASTGRNLNNNIIPASISQNNGKIGSFSFGTQVEERRTATATQAPQTYHLEPVDNVTPATYTASPRPKMLYNGTQNYSPDQFDPFYAVYDEDGELYKDTVQQTYRGTPPPVRRPEPVQYTPRPSADDYDDTLIQGQINNQNQYQAPVRQSTRGEGNELGYEHPSSVKTTIYEATSISTTPTTSTSTTTTYRPTTAPSTEAMTPSRYSPRSSTDENLNLNPNSSSDQNPSDGPPTTVPTSNPINLSSLAKPFEKTDNTHRLKGNLPTEKLTHRHSPRVTNKNNNIPVEVVNTSSNENKKVISLTTGFSIRRNPNNTNNPYTLTVLTRPFDNYQISRKHITPEEKTKQQVTETRHDELKNVQKPVEYEPLIDEDNVGSSESSLRRSSIEEDIPVYSRTQSRPKISYQYSREDFATPPTTTTKYYLKTVIRRPAPAPFTYSNDQKESSTENTIDTEALIETGLQNVKNNQIQSTTPINRDLPDWDRYEKRNEQWNKPVVSPYRTLNNLRNNEEKNEAIDFTTSTASSTIYTTTQKVILRSTAKPQELFSSKPAYYSYKVDDDEVSDQTTEVFSGKVKSVIKAFLSNFGGASSTERVKQIVSTIAPQEEKVVNIGFQKKMLKYIDDKPVRHQIQRVHIITEQPTTKFSPTTIGTPNYTQRDIVSTTSQLISTRGTSTTTTSASSIFAYPETTPTPMLQTPSNNVLRNIPNREYSDSKFSSFNNYVTENIQTTVKPQPENSRKFIQIIEEPSTELTKIDSAFNNNIDNELTKLTKSTETTKTTTETEHYRQAPVLNEIASTTSSTKSTTTYKVDVTPTKKSLSFPTRASRVNPAIKLAATNPGVGRRSYQSTKCSSDNSLQPNPKCNEIKYQRPSPSPSPSSTRGRGSAHYSTLDQPQSNRGTPPTRSRPTLKPSTAIVSKATEFVDIYTNPPRRPAPVYPQPTPDKTAAKCRKDVCLLPDCYCGGKDIPGDLEVETVPQIVLLTFDDSVNDLNKVLYQDLFEKGRVNPNGCPISATFYVSHEWTDYSQVQNLYAAGHEMASHTISHSFGEQFSQKKWNREVGGQREILAAYGGVKLEDVRGMRAPFLSVGGNKMFKMLYDSNFTYDSSLPVYENRPPSWPYTLDYKLFHDCMIPPCPTKSYPGVWEVPMVMWQDLNGGRCSMGDACANPPEAEGVYKMLLKNFDRHYTTNRAPFGLFYHAAWFTQPHHKEGFIMFLDFINRMQDVWIVTNWQALQWVRDPTPINRLNNFQPFQCNYQDRPKKCNNPKVCNLWHKSGVRYMRTCQPCPEIYPWTGKTGIKSSRIDNDIEE
ncbi:mucin-5AC isoform X2 [Cydia pomonella]|uniref:mucin-5AC isoform X2 n=1 Tax=Cydia pomonella TaxID=82600 RepID=UPI002ADE02DF|nr:mucin-5AC isoform X2 [Cydia pomonella]